MPNPSLPGAAFGYGSTKKPEQTKSFVSKPSQNLSVFEPIPMSTSGNITKAASSLGAPLKLSASQPKDRFVPTGAQTGTPTAMDKQVTPSISPVSYKALYGKDATKPKNVSQYRNLTDLMKMNVDSLSGKIKIPDARFDDREAFVPPGYDSDMIPFAAKISAARLNMPVDQYMNMSIMDRVKNFGTEARSMGQELTTGVGQAIDAGKQLVSNLPMLSVLFGGAGIDVANQQEEVISDTTANTGIMSNVTFPPERPESSSLIQTEDARPISFTGQYGGRGLENILSELGLSSEAEYRHYLTLSPEAQKQFLRMNPEMRKGYMSKI